MANLNTTVLFLFLIVTFNNFGQSIKYSFKGGLNISNTDFSVTHNGYSSDRDYDNRISYYIGGALEFPLISKKENDFLLQVEFLYSRQGRTFDLSFTNETWVFAVDQINIPILLKKRFFHNFFINAGCYLGHVINSKKYIDKKDKDEIAGYKNFDAGLLIGLEHKFKFGGFLELRYAYGLVDISKVSYPSSSIEHSYKNRVVQIGIGYEF